ncbi:MAG: hypothetical protein JWP69_59 [Flaviaesturariibacter sp.]|nr:hypothetical protein [Flaviaesturariibacter sp.]
METQQITEQGLKRVLLKVFLAPLFAAILSGLFLLYKDWDTATFIYLVVMVYGNIFFPTFLIVIARLFIKRRIANMAFWKRKAFGVSLLLLCISSTLIIWTIADVIIYNNGFDGFTWTAFTKDFQNEFLGYLPTLIFVIFFLELSDFLTERKQFIHT